MSSGTSSRDQPVAAARQAPGDDLQLYRSQLRRLRALVALYQRRMQRRLVVVAPAPRDQGPREPAAQATRNDET